MKLYSYQKMKIKNIVNQYTKQNMNNFFLMIRQPKYTVKMKKTLSLVFMTTKLVNLQIIFLKMELSKEDKYGNTYNSRFLFIKSNKKNNKLQFIKQILYKNLLFWQYNIYVILKKQIFFALKYINVKIL